MSDTVLLSAQKVFCMYSPASRLISALGQVKALKITCKLRVGTNQHTLEPDE